MWATYSAAPWRRRASSRSSSNRVSWRCCCSAGTGSALKSISWRRAWCAWGRISARSGLWWFQTHADKVLACLFLQSGATVCLGLFTAATVSRLQFLGVRAAGPWIALFGGFLTVFNGMAAALTPWTMIYTGVVQDPSVVLGIYYLSYAFGGPGFSIPMGLLMAGISVSAGFKKLLPKWIVILGIVLAAAGELSWFHLISAKALFLIPLTRFPG